MFPWAANFRNSSREGEYIQKLQTPNFKLQRSSKLQVSEATALAPGASIIYSTGSTSAARQTSANLPFGGAGSGENPFGGFIDESRALRICVLLMRTMA